jgi:RND family efflux transporter MFP subunit
MELFLEYPLLSTATPGKFVIHLTILDDFQPVRSGKVLLEFQHGSGRRYTVESDTLLREGIFTPTVELPETGPYEFSLYYEGTRVSETFAIDGFAVYGSADTYPPEAAEANGGISFLKEQQWKIEFRTEPVGERVVKQAVHAVAEVLPSNSSVSEICAPVAGIVQAGSIQPISALGTSVKAGQRLVSLVPPLAGENSWTENRLAFERASREWERANRLFERKAISEREYERIRQEYRVRKAGFDVLGNVADSSMLGIRSPIDGVVVAVHVQPGQSVPAGQPLVTVVNPDQVWLKVNVFEKDYYTLGTPKGINILVPGLDPGLQFEGDAIRLISAGAVVDPQSRTIPLLVEVANPDQQLKIGQILPAELINGESKTTLAIPASAIFDEESQQVVFVHVAGETFEKRVVTTGNHDRGWVAITHGLSTGERLVTKGGYLVKLASTTAAIGHPHAH